MKKIVCGLLLAGIFLTGCRFGEQQKKGKTAKKHKTEATRSKKKSEKKTVDLNKPVAVYRANKEDAATNNDFIVKVFPTNDPETFKVAIDFGENKAQDNIKFPDPKYYKKVALRKSEHPNACILGFIGKDGKFNEMKEISGSTTQIGIKGLKAYYFKTE